MIWVMAVRDDLTIKLAVTLPAWPRLPSQFPSISSSPAPRVGSSCPSQGSTLWQEWSQQSPEFSTIHQFSSINIPSCKIGERWQRWWEQETSDMPDLSIMQIPHWDIHRYWLFILKNSMIKPVKVLMGWGMAFMSFRSAVPDTCLYPPAEEPHPDKIIFRQEFQKKVKTK